MLYLSTFFQQIINQLSSFPFLLTVEIIALTLKCILLAALTIHGLRASKLQRPWFFLLLVLLGAMMSDAGWIASLTHKIFIGVDYKPVLLVLRLAWAWCVIEYQALSLFIESLIEKKHTVRWYQYIFIIISVGLSLFHIYAAIFHYNDINPRPSIEYLVLKISVMYGFLPVLISLAMGLRAVRNTQLPKIIRKQFTVLIKWLIAPHLLSEFIQNYPFNIFPSFIASNYAVVSISTILLTLAFYFCAKRMIGLRFLNFQAHVLPTTSFSTIERFKDVLEQLSQVTNVKELNYITQSFFKANFEIANNRVTLYIRQRDSHYPPVTIPMETAARSVIESRIEFSINAEGKVYEHMRRTLLQEKILITDEIAFNDFYNETELTKTLLHFLDIISADLFLPVYQSNNLMGYIVVDKDARPNRFYSSVERDELVVFASYLGNIINLLHTNDIQGLFAKDKELQEELYHKHQEINQYKESIRSFLRDTQQKKIGIIFYKNKKFSFGNQAATDLIPLNLQIHEGHPIARTLHKIAHQVQEYKTGQTVMVKDNNNNRLMLSAVPHIEHNTVIILAYSPEISDIIKEQIDLLKDPSDWDYLLYLETTKSGTLIKQLIPGTGPHLLQARIALLKAALHKKALLLDVPAQDTLTIVELLHHISLKETLHVLTLQGTEQNNEIAIKLFGINPIYVNHPQEGLLDKLNNTGTLFIQNIHFLDLETQKNLAEYIRYGFYHQHKSDTKLVSTVRIICSTTQHLALLVKKGTFSNDLYNELTHVTVTIPPLLTLPQKELVELADQLTEQAIQTSSFQSLLSLTEREKNKLIASCPTSMHELRSKVQHLLLKKSQKHNIVHDIQLDPTLTITDPELVTIARLGKKALKDPKILSTLMQKFKNQTKVATFLGVNRSSVNRRCKEYNIAEY
ncbi:MAG: sigma 54-interacting transcriptional regulator [Candidatus Babeliales bacterium]